MKRSLLLKGVILTILMFSIHLLQAQYIVDFEGEGEEKSSYASGEVFLSGIEWNMTDALIGTLDNDWKNGLRAARLRGYAGSSMTMLEDKQNGVGSISFYYRRYGTDSQVDWKVEYSTDAGNNWIQVGAAFTAPASDEVQLFDEIVNAQGDVRIRIKRATEDGSANRRLNIDDLTLTDYSGGGNIPPTIANITQTPSFDITSSTSVAVSAEITDPDGSITLAQLKWGTTSGVYPNTIVMSASGGDVYSSASDIPAQTNGTSIFYVVYAEDNDGGNRTSSQQSYLVKDPAVTSLPYAEDFENDLGDSYTFSLSGDTKYWLHSSNGYAYMNGHNTGELEDDWLILPGFNKDIYNNVVLSFETWKRYGFEDDDNYFKLLYSTDYEGMGNPTLANWTELDFNQPVDEQVWESSGNIDLNGLQGELVYIAFRYHYNTGAYRLWQLDNIQITGVESNVITLWRFDIDGDLNPTAGEGTASLVGGVSEVSQDNALRITDFPDQSTASGTAGIQLMLSTAGYQNIKLSFRHRSSGTMSRYAQIQYTTNGGTSWVPFQDNNGGLSPHDTYYDFAFDLSAITEIANNPDFGLRIVSIFSPIAFDDGLGNSFGPNEAYHRSRISGGDPYSGGGNWRFQDVSITGDVISGNIPVKLAITNVNGGVDPTINNPFNLTVQSQDNNGSPANVLGNTTIQLSIENGNGTLSGMLTQSIPAGSNTVVFQNLSYNVAENGVTIKAEAVAGMVLEEGVSAAFNVKAVATQLGFNNFPQTGQVGIPVNTFEVQAQRPDGTIDEAYTGSVSISKASGSGSLSGTLTKNFANGVASFDDLVFDASGNYTLLAQSTGLTSATSAVITIAAQPEITGEIVPQYIQGINGTNASRLPFAFWVNISNLLPNTTYRYINQAVTENDTPTTNGAGNVIYTNQNGNFYRTSSPSFSVDGAYGTFTADANGQYSGWFMTEATGNARFTPGNEVFFRIRINDGNEGTTAVNYLTTSTAAIVINFGTEPNDVQGTGIRATSASDAKNFVMLYDNANGSGRPVYATSIETTGVDFNASTSWAEFYRNEVASVDGSWGGIVPNVNAAGILRIEERSLADGSIVEIFSSENGVWGVTDTRNPNGGIENILVLNLNLTNDPLLTVSPSVLNGFTYIEGSGPSQVLTYSISGEYLSGSGNINVAAPDDYEVSTDGTTFSQSLNLPYSNGSINGQPVLISVRLKAGLNVGLYNSQTILNSGGGATDKIVTLNGEVTSLIVPEIIAELVPQYIQGINGSNSSRLPFAFWAHITGLQAGATYRYINQVVTASDGPTTNGAGNVIYVAFDGVFVRTSSPSFGEPGAYGEFTADASGNYSGWFMTEPTGNARFTPGNEVYFRIRINDGNEGTNTAHWLTTSTFAKVINFGTAASGNEGTGIRASSADQPTSIVMLFDNAAGENRPLYASSVEPTGVDYATAGTYAGYYVDHVFGNTGAWGGIIPNINSNGIRNISLVNPVTGFEKMYQSMDGVWGDVDTRNPSGGMDNVIYLDLILIGNAENNLDDTSISHLRNTFKIENYRNEVLLLEIFNMMGQNLLSKQIPSNSTQIIQHQLVKGGYIVRLHNGMQHSTKKFIIR